jgi:hypothetical protein
MSDYLYENIKPSRPYGLSYAVPDWRAQPKGQYPYNAPNNPSVLAGSYYGGTHFYGQDTTQAHMDWYKVSRPSLYGYLPSILDPSKPPTQIGISNISGGRVTPMARAERVIG